MRVLSFLAAALCCGVVLASYLPDSVIRARTPGPSAAPCTPVTPSNCPQTSACGDGLNTGTYMYGDVACYFNVGSTVDVCLYDPNTGLSQGYTSGYLGCCQAYIGTCTSAKKRAVPQSRNLELGLSGLERRDIEDENQPW
ncbi:hypothetical protein CALCODRAFT_556088 [Calocera cornea HHB12733]|uniref:Uncharacterized protein n=1 Tax=Calocera cornea HHB12733 TaxID=1353952 RepID=A0A165F3D4_9BASI|nr:hypothetical protein CALCODRAFT_556088 [Calocera cornea HHB12733]